MTRTRFPLAALAAIATLAGGAGLAIAQTGTEQAANDAVEAAQETEAAIRAIDPTTGGPSPVVDPSEPEPYGFIVAPGEERPGLPTVAAPPLIADVSFSDDVTITDPPARGPAARMISNPQVQDIPPQPPALSDDPFVVKSILPIEGTIRYGEWYWDKSRAPATGPIVITVDLDARVISVFRDGHEIGTAVALLGTTSHPTPLGTFPILTKEKDNVSEKYNNAPMPWSLRLTWDGIMIHGSPVANGYASHGCIGVPDPFAERLFEIARRGDKVVITRGEFLAVGDRIIS